MVLGGEGVQITADRLDLAGDAPGGAAFGAFEEEVFEEMGRAVEPGVLVPTADRRPQPDAHAGHVRHLRRGDAQAVGERGQMVRGGLHGRTYPSAAFRQGRGSLDSPGRNFDNGPDLTVSNRRHE